MTKVYEVKKSTIDCLGVFDHTIGVYATRDLAEEVAARKQAVADEFRDDFSSIVFDVVEHEVIGAIDD